MYNFFKVSTRFLQVHGCLYCMEYGEWGMGDCTSWAEVSSEVDFNTVRASKACCRCDCRTLHAQPMGKISSPSLRPDRPGASWPFHPCSPRGVKEPYSGTLKATLTLRGDLRENAEPLANPGVSPAKIWTRSDRPRVSQRVSFNARAASFLSIIESGGSVVRPRKAFRRKRRST